MVIQRGKDEIPNHIGVTDGKNSLKKSKRVEIGLPVEDLYINLICALNREANKYYINQDDDKLMKYRRLITRLEKESKRNYDKYIEWSNKYYELERSNK